MNNDTRAIPYAVEDLRAAMPDYVAARLGAAPAVLHPIARHLRSSNATLRELATSFGHAVARKQGRTIDDRAAMARGYSTTDFGYALATGVQYLVFQTYDATDEHRRFCKPVPVKNFKPVEFPEADAAHELDKITAEAREWRPIPITVGDGLSARLYTWAKKLLVSRELIINDNLEALSAIFANFGALVTRKEAQEVYALLESNPTMSDSAPMFDTNFGNLLTAAALSNTTLAAAMAALRTQPTAAGNKANNRARFLLVDPANEYTALELVRQISVSAPALEVMAAPDLAAGHWYVLADPSVAPAVGRLHLEGSERPLWVQPSKTRLEQDGSVLAVGADFGFVPLSRVGAVRCQP